MTEGSPKSDTVQAAEQEKQETQHTADEEEHTSSTAAQEQEQHQGESTQTETETESETQHHPSDGKDDHDGQADEQGDTVTATAAAAAAAADDASEAKDAHEAHTTEMPSSPPAQHDAISETTSSPAAQHTTTSDTASPPPAQHTATSDTTASSPPVQHTTTSDITSSLHQESSIEQQQDSPQPIAHSPLQPDTPPTEDTSVQEATSALGATSISDTQGPPDDDDEDKPSQPSSSLPTPFASNDGKPLPLISPPLPSKKASLPPTPTPEHQAVAKAFGVATPPLQQQPPATPPQQQPLADMSRTPSSGISIGKGPPPPTNPQEERPFDFNIFLEQLKDPNAKAVGEYVRSFIRGFSKKPYRTADQIKLIFDFLDFISQRMRQSSVWANLNEQDFDNAREAMEKLVMNRLYTFTFTPAVAKEGRWTPQTDDLERDRVLRQRIHLFSWLKEEHLDVPTGDHSRGFVDFAIAELNKINHYKAPRDKLICILNCCKVIFGLIRHMSEQENADTFIPVLIFVVLKANPEHLISNVEYIGRFRNPDKLSSESGYYLSSLMGATAFIETMDYSSLSNITQEQFEKNLEEAVSNMPPAAQPPPATSAASLLAPPADPTRPPGHNRTVSASDPHAPLGIGEGSATNLPGLTPPHPNAASFADGTRAFLQRTGEAARLGFSTSLGKPIGALGKLLGEGLDGIKTPGGAGSSGAATPARVESPAMNAPQVSGSGAASATATPRRGGMFSNLFGGEPSSPSASASRSVSGANPSTASTGFNPGSWSRSFRAGGKESGYYDDDDEEEEDSAVPHTPAGDPNRQGPFSSLVRNPKYSDAAPPGRRIGETPYAPKAARNRPAQPQRTDSIDPFTSPDPSGVSGEEASRSGRFQSGRSRSHRDNDDGDDGIGTPSDAGSDAEDDQSGVLSQARRRLPDLGAFVPSFLTDSPPAPSLARGPARGQAIHPGDSSLGYEDDDDEDVVPSSERAFQEQEVEQRRQFDAGVDTLKSVFPDADDEVRRMVLEACNGDVAQAIDRLLEINQG